jgi:hypothetical protein
MATEEDIKESVSEYDFDEENVPLERKIKSQVEVKRNPFLIGSAGGSGVSP